MKSVKTNIENAQAAADIAAPCSCGISNKKRAQELFKHLGSGVKS